MAVALSSLHDQRDRAPEFFGEVLTREARPSMMPSEEYLESLPLADRRLMERVIEILPFYRV